MVHYYFHVYVYIKKGVEPYLKVFYNIYVKKERWSTSRHKKPGIGTIGRVCKPFDWWSK